MPSGAEYKRKYWLTKTKPVIVKELQRLVVRNALLCKMNTDLGILHDQQDVSLDKQRSVIFGYKQVIDELRDKLTHNNHGINRLEETIAQGFVHLNTLITHKLTPKPTIWERIKLWFSDNKTPLDVVALDKIL